MLHIVSLLAIFANLGSYVAAESHMITFTNNCGHGTPKLIKGPDVLSTGQEYVSNGPFESAIAYLDGGANGACQFNGENCGTVEITLKNGANGAASSADISLIPSHKFSDPLGFEYTGGCAGAGAFCGEDGCNTAYYVSNDDCVLVNCQENDVGVNIIFCGQSTHFSDPSESNKKGSPCNGGNNSTSSGTGSTGTGTGSSSTGSSSLPGSSSSSATVSTSSLPGSGFGGVSTTQPASTTNIVATST